MKRLDGFLGATGGFEFLHKNGEKSERAFLFKNQKKRQRGERQTDDKGVFSLVVKIVDLSELRELLFENIISHAFVEVAHINPSRLIS